MEKQKVKLAINVFSWNVRSALLYYAVKRPDLFLPSDVNATVQFIDASRDFFEILNINHVKKGPIRSKSSWKIIRLKEIGQYFDSVYTKTKILTRETHTALQQTISASILVTQSLLAKKPDLGVMTSYFQQDPIEERFGHHRRQAGCSYRMTPLQFEQTERKLTNISVMKGSAFANTSREKKSALDWNDEPLLVLSKAEIDDIISENEIQVLVDHNYAKQFAEEDEAQPFPIDTTLTQMDYSSTSTLAYIRGSVVRRILNHLNCFTCTNALIENIEPTTSSDYLVLMDFSGNSLLQPNTHLMEFFHIQLTAYLLLKDSLRNISFDQSVLARLKQASIGLRNARGYSLELCEFHKEKVLNMMTASTMKTFMKAFVHEMNENFIRANICSSQKNRKIKTFLKL